MLLVVPQPTQGRGRDVSQSAACAIRSQPILQEYWYYAIYAFRSSRKQAGKPLLPFAYVSQSS